MSDIIRVTTLGEHGMQRGEFVEIGEKLFVVGDVTGDTFMASPAGSWRALWWMLRRLLRKVWG